MTLKDKLCIWLASQDDPYDASVDEFLGALMAEGTLVGVHDGDRYAAIEYHGHLYAVYIKYRWKRDLSLCDELKKHENGPLMAVNTVYHDLRPSRRMKIRFWEWLEESGIARMLPLSPRKQMQVNIQNAIALPA